MEKLYEKLTEQILAGLCFANDCESETSQELLRQRAKAGVIAAKAITSSTTSDKNLFCILLFR